MTTNEALEMKPGRELDAIVAEKVMGWTFAELDNGYGYPAPYWTIGGTEKVKPSNFWNPSGNISNAWEVAEKMHKDLYDVSIWNDHNGKWACEINYWTVDDCDTVQEAICKAALLTVLGESE